MMPRLERGLAKSSPIDAARLVRKFATMSLLSSRALVRLFCSVGGVMRNLFVPLVALLFALTASAGETRNYRQKFTYKTIKDQREITREYDLSSPGDLADFCTNFGETLADEKPRSNIIVLNERGNSCWQSPFFVTGNDIYVVILSTLTNYSWTEPAFDTCGPRPPVLPINGAGGGKPISTPGGPPLAALVSRDQAVPIYATAFISLPHKCYGSVISFQTNGYEIKTSAPKPEDKPFTVSRKMDQYTRYFAGLQIGVIASRNHDQTFGLKPGTERTIYSKSPTGITPQFAASIVFYGILNYLDNRKQPYEGRDVVNEKGFKDKLGASFGTSVSDPTRRVVAGLSYELGSGIDLFVGAEYVRVQALNGFRVGDALPGMGSDIPVHDIGKTGFVIGITLDATYVSTLFHK
jgi:hypothetical protein